MFQNAYDFDKLQPNLFYELVSYRGILFVVVLNQTISFLFFLFVFTVFFWLQYMSMNKNNKQQKNIHSLQFYILKALNKF